MIQIRRVVGPSMMPAFRPGAIVLGLTWLRPKAGSVVVAEHGGLELIKRVSRLGPEGAYLFGDNAAQSTDSRTYGWFAPASIRSVIIGSIQL